MGIAKVEGNEVVQNESWLINPEEHMSSFNTDIHGITEKMVKDAPTFPEFWNSTLKNLLEDQILAAHFANFDMSVLRSVLGKYGLELPSNKYFCTFRMAKYGWPGHLSYALNELAYEFNIPLQHHDPKSDALVSAQLALKYFKENDIRDAEDIGRKMILFRTDLKNLSLSETMQADPDKNDESHIFHDKVVVFTGPMLSMPRKEAQKMVIDIGGTAGPSLTAKTNYLIVGQGDYLMFRKKGIGFEGTEKFSKALKIKEAGGDIEILYEADFLKLFDYEALKASAGKALGEKPPRKMLVNIQENSLPEGTLNDLKEELEQSECKYHKGAKNKMTVYFSKGPETPTFYFNDICCEKFEAEAREVITRHWK